MKGRFTNIEQKLKTILDQELLTDIYAYREKRLSHIKSIISAIADVFPGSTGAGDKTLQKAIETGIDGLREFSEVQQYHTIQDVIIGDIFALKNKFPKREVLRNVPERFQILQDDNPLVKGGKSVKQLLRSMGKTEWVQKIPLQEVVAYHLLDADWFFKDWIAAEERLSMQIILELDQVLAHALKSRQQSGPNAELKQVLKVIQNHIEEAERLHKRKLIEARDAFIEQFIITFAKVGTFERVNSFYSENRLQRKRKRTKKELDTYLAKWRQINQQLLKRTDVRHRFLVFFYGLGQMTHIFKSEIQEIFSKRYLSPFQTLKNQTEEIHARVMDSGSDLASVLADGEQQLVQFIEQYLVEDLRKSIENNATEHEIEMYSQQLIERADEQPEASILVADIDRSEDPPAVSSKEIELKSTVRKNLRTLLLEKITHNEAFMGNFKKKLLQESQDIQEIIEVNFESAYELIQSRETSEDPRDIVDDALQRAISKIEKCIAQTKEKRQMLLESLDEGSDAFRRSIFDLLYHTDNGKQRLMNGKRNISEKKGSLSTKMNTQWAQYQKRGAVLRRFAVTKTKRYYRKATGVLNLKATEPQETKKADIIAYLLETEKQIDSLPYIYRRLFDFKAKAKARYYVGLNEQINYVEEAYRHSEQVPSSVAVVGEKGSGKSTFFDLAADKLFGGQKIWHINAENTLWTENDLLNLFNAKLDDTAFSTVEELITFLKQKQGPEIILLQGIQNVYLRNLNGYRAIEQLLHLITETGNRVFWMVSCSRYAWAFLDKAADLKNYFSPIIQTDTLDEEQIERLILNRHGSSGFDLKFEADEDYKKTKEYRNLTEGADGAQDKLKEKYFKKLTKLSEGNASIAMIFWIRSIHKFDDTHCYISPLDVDSLDMLEDLTPDLLFVLAALVLHDTLTPAELSAVLSITQKESKLILNRLKAKGILVANENRMALNQLIYRQVIRELKERNILHLE